MATIGITTVGALNFGLGDSVIVQAYTAPQSGSLVSMSLYVGGLGGGGSQVMQGIIYADNGSSAPGAALKGTLEITVQSTDSPGWVTATLGSPLTVVSGTTYYLGVFSGTQHKAAIYYDASSQAYWLKNATYPTYPDPFGTPDTTASTITMSIYATYAASNQGGFLGFMAGR